MYAIICVYFTVFLPDDFIGKKWAGFHWCKLKAGLRAYYYCWLWLSFFFAYRIKGLDSLIFRLSFWGESLWTRAKSWWHLYRSCLKTYSHYWFSIPIQIHHNIHVHIYLTVAYDLYESHKTYVSRLWLLVNWQYSSQNSAMRVFCLNLSPK